uniref:Uncharacterized protein n=1 Tax=Oreochromis niloticus TaxID=8128 RepID=A0A669ER81_ORENI
SLFVLVFSDVTGLLYSFQLLVNSKLRDSCSVPLSKAGLDLSLVFGSCPLNSVRHLLGHAQHLCVYLSDSPSKAAISSETSPRCVLMITA